MNKESQKQLDKIVSEIASLALKYPSLRSRLAQASRALSGALRGSDNELEGKSIYIPDPDFY